MTKTKDQSLKINDVAAIVLAAGRSERMGAFKPLLPFGHKTVIDHCIENLRKAGIEDIIVVLGHGPRAEELRTHLKDSAVTFALNPDVTSEMTSSIACGVRQLPEAAKAVVILPVDHPAVSFEIVVELMREWREGTLLVIPMWNDRGGHPVLIDSSFRGELLRLDSDDNGRGLRALFDAHPDQVRRIPVNSNYIARDIDTWDDYAALHQDVFGVQPPKQPFQAQDQDKRAL